MVKKKRGPGRPRKRGRPKGSRNKKSLKEAIISATTEGLKVGDKVTFNYTTPKGWKPVKFTGMETIDLPQVDLKSRLDQCMVNLETAVAEAITKLKESI